MTAEASGVAVPAAHAGASCDPTSGCITCGDVAVEGRVEQLLADGYAVVATAEGTLVLSIALVDAHVGDLALFHAGEAIGIVR